VYRLTDIRQTNSDNIAQTTLILLLLCKRCCGEEFSAKASRRRESWRASGRLRVKANSASLVDFTPVADVVEINTAQFHIELVKHAVIADTQFEFRAALQALVWERLQPCAHFIHLSFHGRANRQRQLVEGTGKGGRPDLERGSHVSLRLAGCVIAGGDFAAGLIERGLHLIGQLKLVFEKVINPRANFLDLGTRQPGNGSFNFLNCAHGGKIPNRWPFAKAAFLMFLVQRQNAQRE
jgi:hypothetical protein